MGDVVRIDQLVLYVDLLIRWNRKINLTSLDIEPLTDAAVDRLIVEPVAAARFVGTDPVRVIDLGSGGGSPAIPFRTQLSAASMRMVETRSRKCSFLRESVRTLQLESTFVEECRFESIATRLDLKHSADVITLRAVRLDDELLLLIRFLLAPAGRVFRFVSQGEQDLPVGLDVISVENLAPSMASELQILRLS